MELTETTPTHTGFQKAISQPFALATRGIGSLDGGITAKRLDADFR